MSICSLMISDFMMGTGQYDDDDGYQYYDDSNLIEGIYYAEWLLEMSYKVEPFYDFNLKKFIVWCKSKIQNKNYLELENDR